jgi:hypothetical protein
MLSRTEKIGEFHLRVSRTERDLYEEFCNTEEAKIVKEMREYFTQAKQKSGVINFDRLGLCGQTFKTGSICGLGRRAAGNI